MARAVLKKARGRPDQRRDAAPISATDSSLSLGGHAQSPPIGLF